MGAVHGRAYGITLITIATVLWSTAGLFVRTLGDLDVWTIQAGRAFFGALSLVVVIAIDRRWAAPRAMLGIGRVGWIAVPLSTISMITYISAVKLTTVANVLICYATLPFFAAGMAWIAMREQAGRRTVIASGVALAGIVVMAGAAVGPEDVAGVALAIAMTASFAVLVVMARRYPRLNMGSVNLWAALACFAICWMLSPQVIPPLRETAIVAVFGIVTTGLAYMLFLTGARYIRSGEAGLIGILDVILGPLWVWWAFNENPGIPAIVGGAIVLAALVWYLTRRDTA